MKRRIIIIALIGLALLAGIGYLIFPSLPSGIKEVHLDPAVIEEAVSQASDKPNWGIGLPEIVVRNYQPGVTVHAAVVVHQGNNGEGEIAVMTLEPWATIGNPAFKLQPMESVAVPIAFMMPQSTDYDGEIYEFAVLVDKKQTSMVQIAYEQKWKIYMR